MLYGVLLIFVVLSRYREFFCVIARTLHVSRFEAQSSLVESVVTLSVGLYFVWIGGGVVGFAWAYAIGCFFGTTTMLFSLRKFLFPLTFSLRALKEEAVFSEVHLYMLIQAISFKLSGALDVIVIRWFWGDSAVAFYQVAKKFYEYLLGIPSIIVFTIQPLLYKSYDNVKDLTRLLSRGESLILMLTLPLIACSYLIRHWIFEVFFTEGYAQSITLFSVFLILVLLMPMYKLIHCVFTTLDREAANAWISIVSLAFVFIFTVILVRWCGGVGAILALILARFLQIVVSLSFLRRVHGIKLRLTVVSMKEMFFDSFSHFFSKLFFRR
jgi:O-antigen/teichoic acid export membrane protein